MKLKRIIALASAFAFLLMCMPALAASYHTDVRVLLSIGSPTSFTFSVIGDYYIAEAPKLELSPGEYTLDRTSGKVKLTVGEKTVLSATVTLVSRDYSGLTSYIKLENAKYGTCTYLGNMTFDVREGVIRAVNTLPLEHYLYGVVPHEMSNSFPLEALKSQAVCARGYALAQCSRYATRTYDIRDTSEDQVYHGYASKYTRAKAAVDATAGEILTYDGDIIESYYSASNGGQTELTGNVWSNNMPYYIQLDDPYDLANPSSAEETSFIPKEFSAETVSLMDKTVYAALQRGANELAADIVTLLTTVDVSPSVPKYAEPSRLYTEADVTLTVRKSDGSEGQLTVKLPLDELEYGDMGNTLGLFSTGRLKLRMRGVEAGSEYLGGVQYDGWQLTKRRYGHGVGLSQRGAQQRALKGQHFLEILSFYYASTKLDSVGVFESIEGLSSDKYEITEEYVTGVKAGTKADEFIKSISYNGGTAALVSSSGAISTGGTVATGQYLRLIYGDNVAYDIPLVVLGDLDGDGELTNADFSALSEHFLNTQRLSGAYLKAADIDKDGAIGSLDALLLIKQLNGDKAID